MYTPLQFPDNRLKNTNKFAESPRLRLYYNLDNKRRLHIAKLRSLCEEKDKLKGLGRQSQDPIPIEGENNMLENVLSSLDYASLDFKCFAYMNIGSFLELLAKDVVF